jgi:hypothetical protein
MQYLAGHFQGNLAGIGYGFEKKAKEIVRKGYKYT